METLIMRGKPVADAYRETIMQRVTNALGKGRSNAGNYCCWR